MNPASYLLHKDGQSVLQIIKGTAAVIFKRVSTAKLFAENPRALQS